jgi:type VI secretion system FHA domain protein
VTDLSSGGTALDSPGALLRRGQPAPLPARARLILPSGAVDIAPAMAEAPAPVQASAEADAADPFGVRARSASAGRAAPADPAAFSAAFPAGPSAGGGVGAELFAPAARADGGGRAAAYPAPRLDGAASSGPPRLETTPQGGAFAPDPPPPFLQPGGSPLPWETSAAPAPAAAAMAPFAPAPAAGAPSPFAPAPAEGAPSPFAPIPAAPATRVPFAPPTDATPAEASFPAAAAGRWPAPSVEAPTAAPPAAPAPPRSEAGPGDGTSDAAVAALFQGLGLDPAAFTPAQRAAMAAEAGRTLAALADGMRRLLADRRLVKRELGVAGTEIEFGANPLKFAPSREAAVEGLLRPLSSGYLSGETAVSDAVTAMQGHQLALLGAIRAGIAAALAACDPAEIETRLAARGLAQVVPALRRAELWERYCRDYAQFAAEAEDDIRKVIGRDLDHLYAGAARPAPGEGRRR